MREQSQAKVLACPGKDGIFDVGLFQHLFRFLVSSSFLLLERRENSWLWSRALLSYSSHWSGKDCEEEEEEELCLPSRGGSNYL